MNDDEVLVAWLRARGFVVWYRNNEIRLTRQTLDCEVVEVCAAHLDMWVHPVDAQWAKQWSVELYRTERGKRRPLRGLVREWVIGL